MLMILITSFLLCIYFFFDYRTRTQEDFELQVFLKLFSSYLLKTDRNILRFNVDNFVIALVLVFPNFLYTIVLFYNGYFFYIISLLPSTFLIIFAVFLLGKEFSANQKVFRRLHHDLLDELNKNDVNVVFIQKYLFLRQFNPIMYPRIKIILLVISFIASFIMPFIPL